MAVHLGLYKSLLHLGQRVSWSGWQGVVFREDAGVCPCPRKLCSDPVSASPSGCGIGRRPLLCLCLPQGAVAGIGQLWDLGSALQPFLCVLPPHGMLSSPCPLPVCMAPEPAGLALLLLNLS